MDLSHNAEALDPASTFLPGLRGTGSGVGLNLCSAVSPNPFFFDWLLHTPSSALKWRRIQLLSLCNHSFGVGIIWLGKCWHKCPVSQMVQVLGFFFLFLILSRTDRCPSSRGCPRFYPSQAFFAHQAMFLATERWIMPLLSRWLTFPPKYLTTNMFHFSFLCVKTPDCLAKTDGVN